MARRPATNRPGAARKPPTRKSRKKAYLEIEPSRPDGSVSMAEFDAAAVKAMGPGYRERLEAEARAAAEKRTKGPLPTEAEALSGRELAPYSDEPDLSAIACIVRAQTCLERIHEGNWREMVTAAANHLAAASARKTLTGEGGGVKASAKKPGKPK